MTFCLSLCRVLCVCCVFFVDVACRCSLFVVRYALFVVRCVLFVVCVAFVGRCSLIDVCCSFVVLDVVCCSLFPYRCLKFVVCCHMPKVCYSCLHVVVCCSGCFICHGFAGHVLFIVFVLRIRCYCGVGFVCCCWLDGGVSGRCGCSLLLVGWLLRVRRGLSLVVCC